MDMGCGGVGLGGVGLGWCGQRLRLQRRAAASSPPLHAHTWASDKFRSNHVLHAPELTPPLLPPTPNPTPFLNSQVHSRPPWRGWGGVASRSEPSAVIRVDAAGADPAGVTSGAMTEHSTRRAQARLPGSGSRCWAARAQAHAEAEEANRNHEALWGADAMAEPLLDRKLLSQLKDPISIATGALPGWCRLVSEANGAARSLKIN